MNVKIAPSLLSADYARLAEGVVEAESGGADWIHVDIMDGQWVPNMTIGPPVLAAIRRVTELPLDVHLMVETPHRHVDPFADAGADILTIHQEASVHLHRTVQAIKERGMRAGVSLNPGTPADTLSEILPYVDQVLVMSVNPGFGGQRFIPSSTAKIARVREMLEAIGREAEVEIEVDGGIAPDTAGAVTAAGATVLVAGAAVYRGAGSVRENIRAIREAARPGP